MSIYELENFRISNLKKLKILKFFLPLFLLCALCAKNTIGSVNLFYFMVGVAVCVSEMKYKFYILGVYLILYIFLFRLNLPNDFTIIFALSLSAFLFYWAVFQTTRHEMQNKFTECFQSRYLESCARKCGFEFERYGKIKYGLIRDSKIFKSGYKLYADNKVFGKFEELDFEFSRLFLYEKDKKFKPVCGVFFHATLDKSINSKFFIVSNDAEFAAVKNLKKFSIADTEFNKIFSVYADDTQNAILSPVCMKRLTDLKKRLNSQVAVSFMGDKIYIFTDTGKEIFELDIYTSVLHKNPANAIKRELLHFLAVTKTLNSNTQI